MPSERTRPQRPGVGRDRGGNDPAGQSDGAAHGATAQHPSAEFHRRCVIGIGQEFGDIGPLAADGRLAVGRQRVLQFDLVLGLIAGTEDHGAGPQCPGRRGGHRPEQLAGVGIHPVAQPLQIRCHPDQGPAPGGHCDRANRAGEESGAQRVDGGAHLRRRTGALDAISQRRADPGGLAAQGTVIAGRKHEQRGRHADQQSDHPAEQPITQRRHRSDAYRQDEDHQRRPLPAGDDLAEQAQDGDEHPDGEAQRHRHPRMRRGQCPQGDQHRTEDRQTAVTQGPGADGAGKVRRDQQCDTPQNCEDRCLGVAGHREAGGRGDRDENGRAQGLSRSVALRIALT